MSYWGNLGSALLGTGSVYSRNSQFIGGNKKYKANQADLNYPIEEGFATSSDIFAVTKKISTAG
ncbi:MAG: hypothetical protein KAR20_10015, partial [Candidatus Heimdallarchaeota archaeon]|nr:hypothetical protein [Candidatus Heimdallarchaeota archaeon]